METHNNVYVSKIKHAHSVENDSYTNPRKKIKISNHLYALLVNLSQHKSKDNRHTYVIILDYCLFVS